MAFQPPSQYIPWNLPMELSKNLRFIDSSGITVTRQNPIEYIYNIGNNLSAVIDNYNTLIATLETQGTEIATLQAQVTGILTSGSTSIPQVNGGCLNGNATGPVNVIAALLVSNACSYNTVLGTPTALTQAILAENSSVLNTLPAFSQNSVMAGLTGWKTSPATLADADNNQWLAYLDARAGISTALAAITPTCNQVHINYQANLPSFSQGFNLYFNGYTFIPAGYTDNGSNIKIVDSYGNIQLQTFNIVNTANTPGPLNISTSGTTLSANSPQYTIYVNSIVQNLALGLTCQKTTIETVANVTSGTTTNAFYTTGVWNGTTSGTTSIILGSVGFNPSFVTIIENDTSGNILEGHNYSLTWVNGIITAYMSPTTGTFNVAWIAFR